MDIFIHELCDSQKRYFAWLLINIYNHSTKYNIITLFYKSLTLSMFCILISIQSLLYIPIICNLIF